MAHRRGFLAEIQHQQRLAQSRATAAARAQTAAQNQAVRARAAQERAYAAASRASEAERKHAEREANAAYVESRLAEVEELNENLRLEYAEIDGLLAATLDVDDFVDLNSLKRLVDYPPFPKPGLRIPKPLPEPIPVPPQPEFREPEPPTGLFGKRKRHEELRQEAWSQHQKVLAQWEAHRAGIPAQEAQLAAQHAALERTRLDMLSAEEERYAAACRQHQQEVAEHNASIVALIAGLGYGVVDAVQEYIGIVLANSIYPDVFPVSHEAVFDPETAELKLTVFVPAPESIRTVKAHRYVKASDEIVEGQLAKKDASERYARAVENVALRSLHEIFEADRRGLITAISLQLGPQTRNPATGRDMFLPLLAVTAARDTFMEIDLSGVVPSATLQHLGAAVSKNPFALTVVDVAGVRSS